MWTPDGALYLMALSPDTRYRVWRSNPVNRNEEHAEENQSCRVSTVLQTKLH